MSDLCMYEIEDLAWDGIAESDDHIVPHPGEEHEDECVVQNDCRKKPRHEVVGIINNADRYGELSQGKEATNLSTLKNVSDKMLEDSWSHKPDDDLPQSEGTRTSSDGFKNSKIESADSNFCLDHNLNDKCAEVDNNLYHDLQRHMSQSESDINFSDNGRENNDLLDYEWPDIGNFEDVDQMLRNCDSSFGLVNVSNEDELCWFSNSHTIDGSEDDSKSGFRSSYSESSPFKSILEQPNYENPLVNGFDRRNTCSNYSTISRTSNSVEPTGHVHNSYVNGSGKISEYVDKRTSTKQSKQSVEDGVYFHSGSLKQPPEARYSDPLNILNKVHHSYENEAVGHSKVEGETTKMIANLDSSNAQQSSCMSSVLDENSLEETSFRHLQQVMEQLDIRTKLCIRDSLYRLARSAEQRHNTANVALVAETKCTGFLDIETDTNPIDRSIAHLLFHRPSNPSNHQSIIGPPTDNIIGSEETAVGTDKKLLVADKE